MANEGIVLKVSDGSTYFIPEEVLEGYRLEGDDHERAEELVHEADVEVEGFVNDIHKLVVWSVWSTGNQLGQIEAQPLEDQAAPKEQQAGLLDVGPRGIQTSRRPPW
jgi:hypothetical protein